jgi:hypothetical protein
MSWYTDWLYDLARDAPTLSAEWVDAGLAPVEARGEVILTDHAIGTATPEQLDMLRTLELYANQQMLMEETLLSRDIHIKWRFQVPSITTLKESK